MPSSPFTLLLLLLLFLTNIVDAAHSRTRPVVRRSTENQWDRTTSVFSRDGRLLQVEYGREATQRGASTVVAMILHNDTLVVLVKPFDQLLQLDAQCWMVASGVTGDVQFLARAVRQKASEIRQTHGQPPTVKELAQYAAQLQHILTAQEAYRPLGCTAMFLGSTNSPALYRTDPGGSLDPCRYCAAGKQQDAVLQALETVPEEQWLETARKALEEEDTVDVWVIRSDSDAKPKCFRNVDLQNIKTITKELNSVRLNSKATTK